MRTSRTFRNLRRLPLTWWLITAVVAVGCGYVVAMSVASASQVSARFGASVEAAVATKDLEPGHVIEAGDLQSLDWPKGLLPKGGTVHNATGLTVTSRIEGGQPVTASRVGPAGLSPAAALLEPNTIAIAIPKRDAIPPLRPSDLVSVLVTADAKTADAIPTVVVARSAKVIDVSATAVTVGVSEEQASRVAYGVARGVVSVALATFANPEPS